MPEAQLDGCVQWSHLSSGHTGANRSVDFFRECFYSSLTLTELRSHMQTIVDACGCHASKQSDSRDRGLITRLPIPYCAISLLYVDCIHGLPLGMQVRIRTNSLEFEFAPNLHECVDPSEFKFATSNSEFEFPLDSLEFTRG